MSVPATTNEVLNKIKALKEVISACTVDMYAAKGDTDAMNFEAHTAAMANTNGGLSYLVSIADNDTAKVLGTVAYTATKLAITKLIRGRNNILDYEERAECVWTTLVQLEEVYDITIEGLQG